METFYIPTVAKRVSEIINKIPNNKIVEEVRKRWKGNIIIKYELADCGVTVGVRVGVFVGVEVAVLVGVDVFVGV